jgi:hypothetical protein
MPIEHGSKFDVYLIAELPRLSRNRKAIFPIGFTVNWASAEQFKALPLEISGMFKAQPEAQITEAHWPSQWKTKIAYLTAQVNLALLEGLAGMASVSEIQLCSNPENRRPLANREIVANRSKLAQVPVSSRKTILAVVDHGCPFAHRALLESDGTSVMHAIWDQDMSPDFPEELGTIPSGFSYGRQVEKKTLNSWIKGTTQNDIVDETSCYRLANYPAMRSTASHGSIVLGLLARDRIKGKPESVRESLHPLESGVDFVFVQLPRSVPLATTRGSVERCMLDGVCYILRCAPKGASVSVVLDYGTEMGPHDGSSWFERALDQIVKLAADEDGITLNPVFCAGNSFDEARNLTLRPSQVAKGGLNSLGFNWHVPRGSDLSTALELWMSDKDSKLEIVMPGRKDRLAVNLANENVIHWSPPSGPAYAEQCVVVSKKIGSQVQVLVRVSPTRFDPKELAGAPGAWEISIAWAKGAVPSDISVYTQWGGKNIGYPKRSIPAKFSANPVEIAAGTIKLDGEGSTWGSACGQRVFVAGGYEAWGQRDRAYYSSGGKSRDGTLRPTLLFVTEEYASSRGILGIGNRSSVLLRARGTSFAAPQLARLLVKKKKLVSKQLPEPAPEQTIKHPGLSKHRLANTGFRM